MSAIDANTHYLNRYLFDQDAELQRQQKRLNDIDLIVKQRCRELDVDDLLSLLDSVGINGSTSANLFDDVAVRLRLFAKNRTKTSAEELGRALLFYVEFSAQLEEL